MLHEIPRFEGGRKMSHEKALKKNKKPVALSVFLKISIFRSS